jgi:hypothetical protein
LFFFPLLTVLFQVFFVIFVILLLFHVCKCFFLCFCFANFLCNSSAYNSEFHISSSNNVM